MKVINTVATSQLREGVVKNLGKAFLFLATFAAYSAHGAEANLAGYEVFPGVASGDIHTGVTFAGWTPTTPMGNISFADGTWFASVSYTGEPGIEGEEPNSVEIIGGRWAWNLPDGTFYRGRILARNSVVTWPANIDSALYPCPAGFAKIHATLAFGRTRIPAGSMDGCLDDTHLSQGVYPPPVWGTIYIDDSRAGAPTAAFGAH